MNQSKEEIGEDNGSRYLGARNLSVHKTIIVIVIYQQSQILDIIIAIVKKFQYLTYILINNLALVGFHGTLTLIIKM